MNCLWALDTATGAETEILDPRSLGTNLQNLTELFVTEDGELAFDFEDEIVAGACITREGEIVNERAKEAAG